MKKLLPLILFFFFTVNLVHAAVIHGTIYDLELNQVNNVIVEVDSVPKQRLVSDNGEYSFNLPKGSYTITATKYTDIEDYIVEESINIEKDGDYILDLFLFPNLDDIDPLDFDISGDLAEPKKSNAWVYIIIIALILLVTILIFKSKFKGKKKIEEKKEKEETKEEIEADEALEKIYDIIKKEKRITQKEIRKISNLSESKISLIISQLESEGKIKKIKKGRTNILLLK